MKPEELDRAVQKGEIGPLYFIHGEEDYLVERAVSRLLEQAVAPEFRDFNYTVFYGKECKGEEIVDAARTFPMFSDRRVIVVRNGEDLSAEALELLLPCILDPSPSTCLVFQAGKIDQRRKFFLELKKRDLLVEYKRLKEDNGELARFVVREAAASGRRIEAAAAELLSYYIGSNLREIVAQLEKLVIFCGERTLIGVEDVKEIVSDTKVDNVFELANALGERNTGLAMRRLHTVLRDTAAPYRLTGALARHFRQLCIVRELLEKRLPQDEISRQSGINPYFLKGMLVQARKFRTDEFHGIFSRLQEADIGMKSGGKPHILLELLVFGICTGEK
jgi:DNA polymerase-3 subunit delta